MSRAHLRKPLHSDRPVHILPNRNMDEYLADFAETRPKGYRSFSGKIISERFKAYLRIVLNKEEDEYIKIDDIPHHLENYIAFDVKQIAALEYLTNDIHRPKPKLARPYKGLAIDGPPLDYLVEHYATDIEEKSLNTGNLRTIDDRLYQAYTNEMRKPENMKRPGLLQGAYEMLDHRRKTVADLLGSTIDEAHRFMASLKDRSLRAR